MGCTSSSQFKGFSTFDDKYEIGHKLGEGGFGQVRVAWPRKDAEDDSPYDLFDESARAVKIVSIQLSRKERSGSKSSKSSLESKTEVDLVKKRAAKKEMDMWDAVNGSPHLVRLLETYIDGSLCFMVMERCRCSILHDLKSNSSMREADLMRIFREMLLGIKHCHDHSIIHRDVKASNFLFGGEDGMTVKLCDFGLATVLPTNGLLTSICGTKQYKPPEMVLGNGYDHRADIWSMGATAYLILYGDYPFKPEVGETYETAVASGRSAPYTRGDGMVEPSRLAESFVRALLQHSVVLRPHASVALDLEFVKEPKQPEKTTSSARHSLKHAFKEAHRRTKEFDEPVDPFQQRTIDQLLKRLCHTSTRPCRSNRNMSMLASMRHFSDPSAPIMNGVVSLHSPSEKRRGFAGRKSNTHLGEGSWCAEEFLAQLEVDSKSTAATPESSGGFVSGGSNDSFKSGRSSPSLPSHLSEQPSLPHTLSESSSDLS